MPNFNDTNFDKSKLKRGSILYSSKISPVVEGEYALFNAYNMSWEGYKFGDSNEITYTGQVIAEINKKASSASLNELRETVDSLNDRSADYYVVRYAKIAKGTTPGGLPSDGNSDGNNIAHVDDDTISNNGENWTLLPQYSSTTATWQITRKVVYVSNGSTYSRQYSGNWSSPMKITGDDGVSYPVHQVLLYQWHNSRTAPTVNVNSSTKPSGWQESPGNATSTNTYLFMIQGQRQDSNYIKWDTDGNSSTPTAYWSTPICLTGPDGKTGEDGTDIEFIYKRFTGEQTFNDNNDNPNHWSTSRVDGTINGNNYLDPQRDDYLGPEEYHWNDNPEGVELSHPYEYCSIRYKTNKTWGKFIPPFLWSKFGENGLDGDGIEYIYTTTATSELPTKPSVNVSTFNDAQSVLEWGVEQSNGNSSGNGDAIWHDDPQNVNNEYQKFQWVSTRKFKTITNDNYTSLIINGGPTITIESSTGYLKSGGTYLKDKNNKNLKVGDKAWFPYSDPELWNWYVNDGTNADRIVMLYKRTNSSTKVPTKPSKYYGSRTIGTYVNVGGSEGWVESPGNDTDSSGDEYLWMSSNYYSEKWTEGHVSAGVGPASIEYPIYKTTDEWSTPVCLTGEPGHEGEDGADIEFIYFRTSDDNNPPSLPQADSNYQQNDWPFVSGVTNYGIFNDGSDAGISYVGTLQNGKHANVWTDNPLGVTSEFDYEYASVRRKPAGNDSQWGDFCTPFLWSKYGEDGVDGDGVEYIFYCPETTTLIDWTDSNNNIKNPSLWDATTSAFQASEYYISSWTDDPQVVGENNKYEYVSQRKKRKITDSNKSNFDSTWTTGNSFTKNGQTYNVGDMVWFPYSVPTLWANYAKDGLATNLVLESDNDNITVGVTSEGTVNNNYSDSANFTLVFNTRPLVLDTDYTLKILTGPTPSAESNYNPFGTKTDTTIPFNTNLFTGNFASLTGNTLTVNIPEGFDMSQYDYIMSITLEAKIIRNDIDGLEINTPAIFTLKISGVELSINDIYQLQLDRQVIKTDPNNTLEKVTVKLKSLTSNNMITSTEDAISKHLYVFYDNCRCSDELGIDPMTPSSLYGDRVVPIGQALSLRNSSDVIEHTFKLYYDIDDTYGGENQIGSSNTQNSSIRINDGNGVTIIQLNEQTPHGILIDTEKISRVFDGANGNPGTDSKSQEFIYLLTNNLNFFENNSNNYYKPETWKSNSNSNYNTDDYPFISNKEINGISYETTINGNTVDWKYDSTNQICYEIWTDNPQGISEDYKYEFWTARSYITSSKEWDTFAPVTIRANWGHSGEDGDGVEYIYYLCNDAHKQFDETINPQYWTNDTDYQLSEYFRDNSGWTDNPSGVSDTNKYEYVSVRKYKVSNSTPLYTLTDNWFTKKNVTVNYTAANLDGMGNNIGPIKWNTTGTIIDHKYDGENTDGDIASDSYDVADYIFSILKNATNKYINDVGEHNGVSDKYIFTINGDICNKFILDDTSRGDIWRFAMLCAEYGYHNGKSLLSASTSKGNSSGNSLWQLDKLMNSNSISSDSNASNVSLIRSKVAELYDNIYNLGIRINSAYGKINGGNSGSLVWIEYNETNSVRSLKQWQPYSAPKLWSSHGIPGIPGGSGITLDFDNPSMQIAVNSNGFIKDNQSVTTYLNVYDGSTLIDPQYIGLSIEYSDGDEYLTFEGPYTDRNKCGCIIYDESQATGGSHAQCTYYTWKIGDIDTDNSGSIESDEKSGIYEDYSDDFFKLNENCKLQFRISYNGTDYYKNVTFVPIQYGKDGADAETFELNCSSSVIHYDRTQETYDPSSVQYNIKHKKGNSAPDFITVGSNGQGTGDYSNFRIYYKGTTEQQNAQLATDPQTHLYGNTNGDLTDNNESGIYSRTGAAVGPNASSPTYNLYSDPEDENLGGDNVVVVAVREVTLVGDNNETLPDAQEEILNALDDSYGWTNIMNTAGSDPEYVMPDYDPDNIQSVINTLTDYATYLSNKGKGYATEAAEVTNIVNAISNVTSTIGTTDIETGAYTINEGYETICVVVRDEDTGAVQKEIMTKSDAITIKEQDVNNKEASSASSSEGGEMSGGIRLQSRSGENPIMYAPPINSSTLNNYTLASNGIINVSNLTSNLTAIEVILVYNNGSNEIWDTDILEIVYDGVDGTSGAFKSTVFTRKSTAPNTPTGGSYSSPIPTSTNPTWTDGIPAGPGPIWASTATFKSTDTNGPTGGWSDPKLMADTELYDVEFSPYTNDNNNGPAENPTNSNRHGATPTTNQRWFDPKDDSTLPSGINKVDENGHIVQSGGTTPAWTDMIWRAEREKTPGTNTYSNWTITRIKGEKGNPGNDGKDAFDFMNDTITLAVDASGHIKKGQVKYSSLNLYSFPTETYSYHAISWPNSSDYPFASYIKEPLGYVYSDDGDSTNDNVFSNMLIETTNYKWLDDDGQLATNYKNYILFKHANNYTENYNEGNTPVHSGEITNQNHLFYNDKLTVIVGNNFNQKAIIPENGIEIPIRIYGRRTKDGESKLLGVKNIKLLGQHIGENAVTYEIVPTANSVSKSSNDSCTPSSLSYVVYKYNGTNISQETSFSDIFRAQWTKPDGTSISYNSTLSQNDYKSLSYVNLNLWYGSGASAKVIDRETIPIIGSGEKGEQGFTGPIVRMRGNWKSYDADDLADSIYFDGTYTDDYRNSDGPLYIDIVIYDRKYYKLAPGKTNQTVTEDNVYGLTPYTKYYASVNWDESSWVEATQFDFVATKLLYADQALINQISSHDFIATNSSGIPVAGITTGRITNSGDSHGVIASTDIEANNISNDSGNPVRIFAGDIGTQGNYSLTNAAFNVRQDGTVNMSKANIVGNVNIGGDVNIDGDNVNIGGHLKAKSLTLSSKNTFFYNSPVDLPSLNYNENKIIYIMYYGCDDSDRVITPDPATYLWYLEGNSNDGYSLSCTDTPGTSLQVEDKKLYTLYSGNGTHPVKTSKVGNFWIITQSDLTIKPTQSTVIADTCVYETLNSTNISLITKVVEFEYVDYTSSHEVVAWNSQIAKVSLGGFNNINVPDTVSRTYGSQPITFYKTNEIIVNITLSGTWTEKSTKQGFNDVLSIYQSNNTTTFKKANPNIGDTEYPIVFRATIEDKPENGCAGCFELYRGNSKGTTSQFKNDITLNISLKYSRTQVGN